MRDVLGSIKVPPQTFGDSYNKYVTLQMWIEKKKREERNEEGERKMEEKFKIMSMVAPHTSMIAHQDNLWIIMCSKNFMQLTLWRNGSASDSRSEGCVFESRRGQLASFSQKI